MSVPTILLDGIVGGEINFINSLSVALVFKLIVHKNGLVAQVW